MTYEYYTQSPFSVAMDIKVFTRLNAYAEIGMKHLINSLAPVWIDVSVCEKEIEEATVMQIAHLYKNDVDSIATGRAVKSESLDGYSRTYDEAVTIGGMSISLFAQQHLETSFREAGLMYRGLGQ